MQYRIGQVFEHRLRLGTFVKLIERLPPEQCDDRRVSEWVVDIDGADSRMFNLPGGKTTVMSESLLVTEFKPYAVS